MKQSLFDDEPRAGTAAESFGINSDFAKRFEVSSCYDRLGSALDRALAEGRNGCSITSNAKSCTDSRSGTLSLPSVSSVR